VNTINNFLLSLDGFLGSAFYFPWLLLGVGLFFTVYLGFPQLRFFSHAFSVLTGKHTKKSATGDTSHFQALTTALSGTVGTGNIGGVGLAIFLGGPAALFWMWVTAFLGMATKFVEVSLSHKYRVKAANGTVSGGPMYYMERGLNMKWLAVFFAVATVISSFGTGNMPQINNIAQSVHASFNIPHIVTGGVLSILMMAVIVGGIHRIALLTQAIVPTMAVLYTVGALGVIFANLENILPSFAAIFSDIFTGSSATGGFLGASFAYAFNRGVNRGLYSNEAGQGSAPIAHASARTEEPVAEGMVSLLEPFIDTIVICTLTGLVILSSGAWIEKYDNVFQSTDMMFLQGHYSDQVADDQRDLMNYLVQGDTSVVKRYNGNIEVINGKTNSQNFTLLHARSIAEDLHFNLDQNPYSGMLEVKNGRLVNDSQNVSISGRSLLHSAALTTKAFTYSIFGEYGKFIVTIGLVLFAFSTAVAWSYYGDRAMIYLFGFKSVLPYRIVYCLSFFVASFLDTRLVWNMAAISLVLMTIPNLLGIMLMRKEMKRDMRTYEGKMNKE